MSKDILVAYTQSSLGGYYGYIEIDANQKLKEGCVIPVVAHYAFGSKTYTGSTLIGNLPCEYLALMPDKKPLSKYSTYEADNCGPLPLKENTIIVKKLNVALTYIEKLYNSYRYNYVSRLRELNSIEGRSILSKNPEISFRLNRATDLLPPEYSCKDCIVASVCLKELPFYVSIFSNVKDLMDVDGEIFTQIKMDEEKTIEGISKIFNAVNDVKDDKKLKDTTPPKDDYKPTYTVTHTGLNNDTIIINPPFNIPGYQSVDIINQTTTSIHPSWITISPDTGNNND